VGGLVRAFGADGYLKVVEGLQDGTLLLVLDALDEAHLRAGLENLEAFVGDIATTIRGPSKTPSVVMLARVETAVVVQLMLETHGMQPALARLDYFDETAARQFLDVRLSLHWQRLNRPPSHQRNAAVYRQAVDGVFAFIYACFGASGPDEWGNEQVRRFLGYAPVLEAIADYLAVENLQSILGELGDANVRTAMPDAGSPEGPWGFLLRVIDRMVERERSKVIDMNIKEMLRTTATEAEWDDWDMLYGRDEQVDRVLRRFFRIGLFSDQMPLIPERVRDDYERSLEPMADQHPFLTDSRSFANLVFQEYAFAWAITAGSPSVREAVRTTLKSGRFLPSPLLGRFLLGLAPRGEDGSPLVAPDDVGLLYDSLAAAAARSGEVLIWVVSTESDGTVGQITRDDDSESLAFLVRQSESPLIFWRKIAYADIAVEGGVALGLPGQTFVLGPDVIVETDILETPAAEYVVLGNADSYSRLAAAAHVPGSQDTQLKVYSEGPFEVSWEPLVHPWYPYGVAPPEVPPELELAFRDLVSIVKWFRKHGRDEYARKKELIDNVVIGRNASDRNAGARSLLAYMLDHGVLSDSRGLYFINLSQIGMSWADVQAHRMTSAAEIFLTGFVMDADVDT
jgi:hypothetical protein